MACLTVSETIQIGLQTACPIAKFDSGKGESLGPGITAVMNWM